jgi:SAM-dependent methyltransferase
MEYSEHDDFIEKENLISDLKRYIDIENNFDEITNKIALEIGGSGGILGGLVANLGFNVICTDIININKKYNGEFAKLLSEKFYRNNRKLELDRIDFQVADAQHLIYRDNFFDFIFSLNALEHIPNPELAIQEILRVLKPGGKFYASFDPIWSADTGNHFSSYVKEPWLHLLVEDDEFCKLMLDNGASEIELAEYKNAMNRKLFPFYENKIRALIKNSFSKFEMSSWGGCVDETSYNHPNRYSAAAKLGLNPSDLLIRGFKIIAEK